VFCHDVIDKGCRESLASQGVELVACAAPGATTWDIEAARGCLAWRDPSAHLPHSNAGRACPALPVDPEVAMWQPLVQPVRGTQFLPAGPGGFDLMARTAGIVERARSGGSWPGSPARVSAWWFVSPVRPLPRSAWAIREGSPMGSDHPVPLSDVTPCMFPYAGNHHIIPP